MRPTGNMRAPCPTCGYGVQVQPHVSAVVVCLNCGAWLLPAGESNLRAMTQREADQLPPRRAIDANQGEPTHLADGGNPRAAWKSCSLTAT